MLRRSFSLIFSALVLLAYSGCERGQVPAGGAGADHVDHLALEHAADAPVPGFASRADGVDLTTARVVYGQDEDGQEHVGYLARPALDGGVRPAEPAERPAVIVIHEWWGLNNNIRDMTRLLASEGYTALAVDLYGVDVPAQTPEDAQRLMGEAMERQPALEGNLRQAYDFLVQQENASGVAVIGWCFGGMWALRTAIMLGGDLDAAVVYYGQLERDRARLAQIEAPVLGIFGAEDSSIPLSDVRELEDTLDDLGKDVEVHIYEGAGHAFANPSGRRYEAEAAEDAWERTRAFLSRHLD